MCFGGVVCWFRGLGIGFFFFFAEWGSGVLVLWGRVEGLDRIIFFGFGEFVSGIRFEVGIGLGFLNYERRSWLIAGVLRGRRRVGVLDFVCVRLVFVCCGGVGCYYWFYFVEE